MSTLFFFEIGSKIGISFTNVITETKDENRRQTKTINFRPVSYTHLDVYKRQMLSCRYPETANNSAAATKIRTTDFLRSPILSPLLTKDGSSRSMQLEHNKVIIAQ